MNDDEVSQWLSGLKRGDDRPMDHIWRAYFEKLMRLIRNRLGKLPLRVADDEDIALSALNSLYDGVQAGRFPRLEDRDDLWKILVTLACRKTNDFRDKHFALKRGGGAQRGESVFESKRHPERSGGLDQVLGHEPTPEVAAAIAETIEMVMASLPDDALRGIATQKMEGYTNDEIALKLGCTTRTIERKLEQIRKYWSAAAPPEQIES